MKAVKFELQDLYLQAIIFFLDDFLEHDLRVIQLTRCEVILLVLH